ncbi:MAG: MBL fold metallo-hydrolase [Flavobacterium sp.]|nr:MAG: MBL fold metallo-hydrolase [Flavobacterium sp.]
MEISILKAFNGDSILISFDDELSGRKNILLDGGIDWTYSQKGSKGKPIFGDLYHTINTIRQKEESIDLLIITHIDDDHIGGILKWLRTDLLAPKLIKEVWFNSGPLIAEKYDVKPNPDLDHFIPIKKSDDTSLRQGQELYDYLQSKGVDVKGIVMQGDEINFGNLNFKILSPNEEKLKILLEKWKKKYPSSNTASKVNDYSISIKDHLQKDKFEEDAAYPNGSSIAFLLTYNGNQYLFLGDSHPSVIIEGLKNFEVSFPIRTKLTKISHHGSKGNTNNDLLELIEAEKFVISTNGRKDQHPHKQLLSRIISLKRGCNLYFNYPERMAEIFSDDDKSEFQFSLNAIVNPFDFSH